MIATVVAAFEHDPAFRFFFPDHSDYLGQASTFVGYLFDKRVRHQTVWMTDGAEAVALWSPPGAGPHAAESGAAQPAELRAAMLAAIGPAAAERLQRYDAEVDGGLPRDEPYWYLGILALHPNRRGSGLARRVMDESVDYVQQDQGTAYLETTNSANVAYYQRHGWTLTETIDTSDGLSVSFLRH